MLSAGQKRASDSFTVSHHVAEEIELSTSKPSLHPRESSLSLILGTGSHLDCAYAHKGKNNKRRRKRRDLRDGSAEKVLAAKPEDLLSIPRIHTVQTETGLGPPHRPTPTNKCNLKHRKNISRNSPKSF